MKKTTLVFLYIKYSKFWSVSLEHFVEHKPLISEKCCSVTYSMYQLLRNILEFFLFEEALWTSFTRNKKWNRQCFLSPSSHTQNFGFYSQHVLNKPSAFLSLYFLFPKTTKEGSSRSSFWHSDGPRPGVYPKFGFSEVPRNDNGLNKFIWKNNHQIQQKNLGKSLVLFWFRPFLEIPETSLFWQWNWTWYSPLNFKRQMYKKIFLKCRLLFKRK